MTTKLIAADASAGTILDPSVGDGALVIQTGAAGAKVDAISIAADGTSTLLKPPKLAASAVVSMVKVNSPNGYGSTNTPIRRFSNITNGANGCIIQGSDITFADSATLGSTFTVNQAGVYAISYGDSSSASTSWNGISINSVNLTTAVTALAAAELLSVVYSGGTNAGGTAQWTGYLAAGTVLRPHTSSVTNGTTAVVTQFTIVRVA